MSFVLTTQTDTERLVTFSYNGETGYTIWLNLRTGDVRIHNPAGQIVNRGKIGLTSFNSTAIRDYANAVLHVVTGTAPA